MSAALQLVEKPQVRVNVLEALQQHAQVARSLLELMREGGASQQLIDADIVRALEAEEVCAAVKELVAALEQSQAWIMEAVTKGSSLPSTATLFRNKAALERAGGAA